METEIWKDINGYEGLYQVSNLGNVKSLGKGKTHKKEKLLALHIDKGGYIKVVIQNKNFQCHRLVAQNFIPNTENKPCVNHKDNNRHNNNVKNLEWVTYKENIDYMYKMGYKGSAYGKKGGLHNSAKKVAKLDLNNNVIEIFSSIIEATKNVGLKTSTGIILCCKGIRPNAGGYKWKYI